MKELVRYILGYAIGFSIFILLIPFLLIKLSAVFDLLLRDEPIHNISLQVALSAPFFILGTLFLIWSNITLFKIGKGGPTDGFGMAISPRTRKLVIIGPYRYTRNPMVFGAFSAYLALSIFLDSLLCILVLLVFFFIAAMYLRASEEKRLLKDFGNEFAEYKKRVPMIIPFLRLGKR
jgi:protein-S-isoprenylcysteine O-methyltransferase Ste14